MKIEEQIKLKLEEAIDILKKNLECLPHNKMIELLIVCFRF